MAFRHGQESLSRVVDELDRILDRYRGRLLVHSQTFTIARDVVARSRHGGRFELYEGGGRDGAVERYKAGADRVLIGPSVKHGVDLLDGLCDAVVILVVPLGDWGEARVRARVRAASGQD
jgi:Rad3-related DNA helicase